jgi:hypothetical protein
VGSGDVVPWQSYVRDDGYLKGHVNTKKTKTKLSPEVNTKAELEIKEVIWRELLAVSMETF